MKLVVKKSLLFIAFLLLTSGGIISLAGLDGDKRTKEPLKSTNKVISTVSKNLDSIIVAGGCFWCVESDFEPVKGVIKVTSGYINGTTPNPTYKQVSSKKTGHYEAAKIEFDSSIVSIQELVDYFWLTIDPTDATGQFCDRGSPYKTGLFYQNVQQRNIFEKSLEQIKKSKPFKANIVTPVLEAQIFYPAENYHQNYYTKNPIRYNYYRDACRRDKTIEGLWGKVASKKYH